jgi:hypothetical protein
MKQEAAETQLELTASKTSGNHAKAQVEELLLRLNSECSNTATWHSIALQLRLACSQLIGLLTEEQAQHAQRGRDQQTPLWVPVMSCLSIFLAIMHLTGFIP